MKKQAIVLTGLLLTSSSTFSNEEGSCASVYVDATRNVNIATRILIEQDQFFTKHCENNGLIRTESLGLDLTVPIKQIKADFSGTKNEALEEMKQFCKESASDRKRFQSSYDYNNSVVVDALRSFNQCRALEAKGININHKTTDVRSLVVKVHFNPTTDKIQLNSVQYDPLVADCFTDIKGIKKLRTPMKPVKAKAPFSVSCTRIAENNKDGNNKFNRFELLLDTNQGAYSVAMPTEEMLGYDIASVNKRKILAAQDESQKLRGELGDSLSRNNDLTKKMQNPKVKIHTMRQGSGLGSSGIACDHNINTFAKGVCGSAIMTPVLRITPESNGGSCGYRTWQWACVSYN